MTTRRVLAIGLDGYERSLEAQMIADGELPGLAAFQRRSARFELDHGPAQRTGLAWEHFSSGLSPDAARRWAAVSFDPSSYSAWQEGTRLAPFVRNIDARTVVFDPPYFDLSNVPNGRGVVNWGAHDPGIPPGARPADLLSEIESRFGQYPAKKWIYGTPWASPERCAEMGRALTEGATVRGHAARWLLSERLPDWELAVVVVSEPHSAIEGLWHGVDLTHPLHHLPSAGRAGQGLKDVYRATDRLISDLAETFPDATTIVFSMGGMGPNQSDVASMVLLPELLYRHAFGRPLMQQSAQWADARDGLPLLSEGNWSREVNALIPDEPARRSIFDVVPNALKAAVGRAIAVPEPTRLELSWMPAVRYRRYWEDMRAFALPSFYDGRVRINLAGRERKGTVRPSDYVAVCDEIESLVRSCVDPRTGDGVVDFVERPGAGRDPRTLHVTESDLVIVWKGPLALDHPTLGRIGPVPFRRTGGHTGPKGLAYVRGAGIETGDRGTRASFDVVPTVIELLGARLPGGLSGSSLFAEESQAARRT